MRTAHLLINFGRSDDSIIRTSPQSHPGLGQRLLENVHSGPKFFSDFLRFAPQFPRPLKIIGSLLRCSRWKLYAVQNPCVQFVRVSHHRTAPSVVYSLDRQPVSFPTLDGSHAISEMSGNLFQAGENHRNILQLARRRAFESVQ